MDKNLKQLIYSAKGFEWDSGNENKNWIKHGVSISECEQIFFNLPFVVNIDYKHSGIEDRFYALGHTDLGRELFIVFTIRNSKIRVISARDMSKKEKNCTRSLKMKKIPKFKNEDEEREFWSVHDSTDYIDWNKAKKAVFPNLKPSTKTISLRLSESLLDELKFLANKKDVPYQSLMKVFLSEKVQEEIDKIVEK